MSSILHRIFSEHIDPVLYGLQASGVSEHGGLRQGNIHLFEPRHAAVDLKLDPF